MRSGRFIGVMSGTSLDGIDVVLATITENMVAQQASLTWPIPHAIKEEILAICQGQSLTLSQLGRLDTRLGRLFADAVLALMRQESLKPTDVIAIGCHGPYGMNRRERLRIPCKLVTTTRSPPTPG